MNQVARGGAGNTSQKADYEYDSSDGVVTKMTYGNGAYVTYDYNGSGALTKISHYSAGATLLASNAYEFDEAGNVTKLTLDDNLGAGYTGDATVTYEYDDLYRLTKEYCDPAVGSQRIEYGYKYWYDAVGNRTRMDRYDASAATWYTTEYSYSSRNELESVYDDAIGRTWWYEHDARGNLTRKSDDDYGDDWYTEYFWSSRDLLTKVHVVEYDPDLQETITDTTVEYKYDLMGRRAAKRVDYGDGYGWTPWRWYFYDGLKVIAEGRGTNDKTFYTNGPGAIGGIICRECGIGILPMNTGGTPVPQRYHYDRLGNVVGVTDASGNVVSLYTMEALGTVLQMTNGGDFSNERSSDVQPYHLTTKEYDADSGLYYFNARWYDRATGRFVSRDPVALAAGERVLSSYVFCLSNPIGLVDPTGKRAGKKEGFSCPSGQWPTMGGKSGGGMFIIGVDLGEFTAFCSDADIECHCTYWCLKGGYAAGFAFSGSIFAGGRFHKCFTDTDLSGWWGYVTSGVGAGAGLSVMGLAATRGRKFWMAGANWQAGAEVEVASVGFCIIDCQCKCGDEKSRHGPTEP